MSDPRLTSEEWHADRIGLGPGSGSPGDIYVDDLHVSKGYESAGFLFRIDAEILVEGRRVDLWGLLRWFHTAGDVMVTVWRDQDRYDRVIRVEFR